MSKPEEKHYPPSFLQSVREWCQEKVEKAVIAEREACAKVADKWEQHASKTADRMGQCIVQSYVRHEASTYRRTAAAIRARAGEEE